MKNTVLIRNVLVGDGVPKICTSIIGETQEKLIKEVQYLKKLPVDIIEWRVDWFQDGYDETEILQTLTAIREEMADIPLLFTIRTCDEGGEKHYTGELYSDIIKTVAQSGFVDAIDIEIYKKDIQLETLISEIHTYGVAVVASNHDFSATPDKDEIINRLVHMQNMESDILKIAVMPQNTKDVLTLLDATREMVEEHATKPVVTMSMSSLGTISRVAGGTFGSAMTFGAGDMASAPGQIRVSDLANILKIL